MYTTDDRPSIGLSDYGSMAFIIIMCTALGLFHSRKKEMVKSLDGYLLGGRNMGILPVAFSIFATKVSGIAVAGGTGEEYLYGATYSFLFIGYFVGQITVSRLIVPVFRRDNYVSIYEYLERRFDKSVRLAFSLMYLISNVIYLGIVLYVPAVSITALSGIPYELTVVVTGLTCTVYCVLGGYEAVVWTDVLQMLIIFFSFLLIVVKGTIDGGGIAHIWNESLENGFFSSVTFSEEPTVRYSVLAIFFSGMYTSFRDLSSSQAGVQRILSVKSTKDAQRTTILSAVLGIIFMILLTASAVVLYVNFHDCNPLQRSKITGVTTHDQMFLFATVAFLQHIPCLSGIALSGLICSALSTFSSFINAFATITLEDYMKPLVPHLVSTEKKKILACKILTGVYGVVTVLFSFLVPFFGGAIKSTMSLLSLFAGPMSGAMVLAMLVRRCDKRACLIGLLSSIAFSLCIQVGGLMHTVKQQTLPLSTDMCPSHNFTYYDQQIFDNSTFNSPNTKEQSVFPLFTISFMWYGPIGLSFAVIVGWLASFFSEPQYVDPRLLHPLIAPYTEVPSNGAENGLLNKSIVKEKIIFPDESTV